MTTQIVLKADDVTIPANLNDTVAARDFIKRLPLKLSGFRSDVDYCCHAACGLFDPSETQAGWKNGDISLADGWFAILFAGEELSKDFRGMMVIAHIEEEHLNLVKVLPQTVRFTIELSHNQSTSNE